MRDGREDRSPPDSTTSASGDTVARVTKVFGPSTGIGISLRPCLSSLPTVGLAATGRRTRFPRRRTAARWHCRRASARRAWRCRGGAVPHRPVGDVQRRGEFGRRAPARGVVVPPFEREHERLGVVEPELDRPPSRPPVDARDPHVRVAEPTRTAGPGRAPSRGRTGSPRRSRRRPGDRRRSTPRERPRGASRASRRRGPSPSRTGGRVRSRRPAPVPPR